MQRYGGFAVLKVPCSFLLCSRHNVLVPGKTNADGEGTRRTKSAKLVNVVRKITKRLVM
ncbi:hypothetical protein D3C74_378700 [compost metagenome]